MPAHELHQSQAVVDAARFSMGAVEYFDGFLDRGEVTESACNEGHVVIDRLRNAHDRKWVGPALSLLKELVAAALGTVATDGEQDMHVALDQVVHSSSHVDGTARSAKDCSAVMVNLINEFRREYYRLGTVRRIKALIAASKPQDFHHSVGVMELEKKRADHVVQAWTQAAAGHDSGAGPPWIEKQLRTRPGELKQDFIPFGCGRIAYDIGGNSCLITDRMSHW